MRLEILFVELLGGDLLGLDRRRRSFLRWRWIHGWRCYSRYGFGREWRPCVRGREGTRGYIHSLLGREGGGPDIVGWGSRLIGLPQAIALRGDRKRYDKHDTRESPDQKALIHSGP